MRLAVFMVSPNLYERWAGLVSHQGRMMSQGMVYGHMDMMRPILQEMGRMSKVMMSQGI